MKAVIMAGGQGARLRPLTCDRPKPMVPVVNRPILEHLIHLLKAHGFTDIIITTHYLPEQIEKTFGDGSRLGVSLRYVCEPKPLGTAGSVKQIDHLLAETFLVISGDSLTDFPLDAAVRCHRGNAALATLVVTEVEDPLPYGIVSADGDGRLRRFLEKPDPSQIFSHTVNTGIYVLEPEALRLCPDEIPFDFSRDLFPALLAREEPLYVFKGLGYWSDIGDCDQYIRSQCDALNQRVRLTAMPQTRTPGVWVDRTARLHPSAQVVPPVMIGPGARVEARARVGPGAVLGGESRVQAGAIVERSVIWDGGRIGPEAVVAGAAVGTWAVLGPRARLMQGAAVGDRARVRASATVKAGGKVWAGADLSSVSG